MMKRVATLAALVGGVLLAIALGIQLVPYGRAHTNPPVRQEPAWDSPQTRDLAKRACYDCHSNETVWPIYSHVAPFSWMVQEHVDEGRQKLNFSEFDRPQDEADEAAEVIVEGEMPMPGYVLLHPEAALTPAERDRLVAGLQATFGQGGPSGHQGEDED